MKDADEAIYELKSIVIHSGGAKGGHYWAYIKDDLKEGNWFLDKVTEYQQDSSKEAQASKQEENNSKN